MKVPSVVHFHILVLTGGKGPVARLRYKLRNQNEHGTCQILGEIETITQLTKQRNYRCFVTLGPCEKVSKHIIIGSGFISSGSRREEGVSIITFR